ncbi:MAG: NUDIX domain-containing protein [Anaerolineae bacterium]|nr:NUDIX domain-containing protein [Anaerolineae bacterium]MDW8299158.1 NUDIX domain-containing protein [Anaerolineae bacterium]
MSAAQQGFDSSRWMVIPRTLVFLTNDGDLLLLKRSAQRRVFPNRYNGLGGHVERDETIEAAALREVHEECGIAPDQIRDFRLRAISHIASDAAGGIVVFIFTGEALTRTVQASAEGELHWIPLPMVYGLPLVDDLPHLLPRLFGETACRDLVYLHVRYDAGDQMVISFSNGQTK